MNEGKISCLEKHKIEKNIIQLILIYPNIRPIFKKGKVVETFDDSFIFDDIIEGIIQLSYDNLSEIKILEKGNG